MIEQTKVAIANAFKELLKQKSISKITVQDIASLAKVSRHTFYYHFRDIYSLTQWIFFTEGSAVIKNYNKLDDWKKGMKNALEYALENREMIIKIYHSSYRENIINFLFEIIASIMNTIIIEDFSYIKVPELERKGIINFYTYGLIGILCEWLDNNMESDYKSMMDSIYIIIHGAVEDALLRFSSRRTSS